MIVEDEESIRESFKLFLEDLGHNVITADAPHQCDVYKGHQCTRKKSCTDVLIIDHHLPNLLGLDFIEQLKERGCQGIISNMLLMSGDATSINPDRARNLGVTVVQKPMTFEFLEGWLKNVKV